MDLTPRLGDTDNNLLFKIAAALDAGAVNGITQVAADARYVLKSTASVMTASLTVQAALTGQTFTNTTGNATFTTDDSATTFAYAIVLRKRGTTGDVTAAVTLNSELGQVVFQAWNGSAYVNSSRILARAAENQSSGHAGGFLEFQTCPVGSASTLGRCFVSAIGNFVLGNTVTVEPASLLGGVVFKDGTAASADPTTGSAIWSVGGVLQYRSSGANEGSGITGQIHNRAAQQAGVGTDYTLTNSMAQVAFGTTNAAVTLPTAGTYLILANVSVIDGVNSGDVYSAKLRNTTDSTDIGVAKKNSGSPAAGRLLIALCELVTTTAVNKTVSIFAQNETAARGSVESTSTDIRYVRLF